PTAPGAEANAALKRGEGPPCEPPGVRRAVWKGLAAHGVTLGACLLLLVWTLELWRLKLSVPMHFIGDAALHQALMKGTADHGWYLRNGDLGAPFGLEMYDFPMADHLHFFLERVIGLFDRRPGVIFNVYYLLTFPLAAAAALFALRRFGVGYPAAVVVSLLFTFLPYHFFRLHHLHLP